MVRGPLQFGKVYSSWLQGIPGQDHYISPSITPPDEVLGLGVLKGSQGLRQLLLHDVHVQLVVRLKI